MSHGKRSFLAVFPLSALVLILLFVPAARAAKKHVVYLGPVHLHPYSAEGDPSGAKAGEAKLPVRALVADGKLKDWTTGEAHEVTDRTFVVRQAVRMNDALPGEKGTRWVWQRGPWLLVNRDKASVSVLHLPGYEPPISEATWFRDLAAYCGVNSTGKQLDAVVYRIGVRKPVLSKRLGEWSPGAPAPVCGPAVWSRSPLSVTFEQNGAAAATYEVFGNFAILSQPASR